MKKKLQEWKKACDAGNGSEWLDQQPAEIREAIRATEDYQDWLFLEIEKADAHSCWDHLIPYDSDYLSCAECGALVPRAGNYD